MGRVSAGMLYSGFFSLIQMEQTLEAAAATDVGPFSYHSI